MNTIVLLHKRSTIQANGQSASVLCQLKSFLIELYKEKLEKIVLFGSRARGDNSHDSDFDILIVLNTDFDYSQGIEKNSEFISKLSLQYDIVISRYFTKKLDYYDGKTPFFLNIKREGVFL